MAQAYVDYIRNRVKNIIEIPIIIPGTLSGTIITYNTDKKRYAVRCRNKWSYDCETFEDVIDLLTTALCISLETYILNHDET